MTPALILVALISMACVQPATGSEQVRKATRAQANAQLVAMQPPPMTDGPDRFALDVNCAVQSADQRAIDECTKDLDLIMGLGVGTVRLGAPWEFMTNASTLDPKKVLFEKALLNAARSRGMKILFQVGLHAPVGAYKCSGVQDPPTQASSRLDFCDSIFTAYLSALMDVVLPFTADIELFNEVNWGFATTAPSYGATDGAYGYVTQREKVLYTLARHVLDEKAKHGYKAVLHSQGISYFYNSAFPDDGWKPPAGDALIEATDDIKAVGNYSANPSSPLNAAVDVVDVHAYFNSGVYLKMMKSFIDTLATLTTSGPKKLWITETNNGAKTDEEQSAVFDQVKVLMDRGQVQKAFWYVIRNDDKGNGEGDVYSIYSYDRRLIRPGLAAAIKAYSESIPVSSRFLPDAYRTPIQ